MSAIIPATVIFLFLISAIVHTAHSQKISVGPDAISRPYYEVNSAESGVRILLSAIVNQQAHISLWHAYFNASYSDSMLRFFVLRPSQNNMEQNSYVISHITMFFSAQSPDYNSNESIITYRELKPVLIQTGDMLGFQFVGENPVPYDTKACEGSSYKSLYPELTESQNVYDEEYLLQDPIGTVPSDQCRLYSFQAEAKIHKTPTQAKNITEPKCEAIQVLELKNGSCWQTLNSSNPLNAYPRNSSLCWILKPRVPDHRIILDIVYLDLSTPGKQCGRGDHLQVRNGLGITAPLKTVICEANVTPSFDLVSPRGGLTLVLKSDDQSDSKSKGFIINYTSYSTHPDNTSCKRLNATESEQKLTYPGSNSTCFLKDTTCWLISAAEGFLVQMTLDQLRMNRTLGCDKNNLVIRDGDKESSTELATFCPGNNASRVSGLSQGSLVLVHFRTAEIPGMQSGFSLTYKLIRVSYLGNIECRTIEVNMKKDEFEFDTTSQGWKLAPVVCWKFYHESTEQKALKISMNLQHKGPILDNTCEENYLEIVQEDNSTSTFCHSEGLHELLSVQQSVYVLLHHNPKAYNTIVTIEHETEDISTSAAHWTMVLIIIAVILFIIIVLLMLKNSYGRSWMYS